MEQCIYTLLQYLFLHKANHIILDPLQVKDLIVYGSGEIATQIIGKTNFFKLIKNYDIVDGNPNLIGRKIFGKEIRSTSLIENNSRSIFIATAQHYDEVYKNILNTRGGSDKIISGLII